MITHMLTAQRTEMRGSVFLRGPTRDRRELDTYVGPNTQLRLCGRVQTLVVDGANIATGCG